jgi:hypothetical protein
LFDKDSLSILLRDRLFLAEVSAEPLPLAGQVSHVAALSFEPDEPQGSGLPGDAEEGIQQGLYVTLPAEELTKR